MYLCPVSYTKTDGRKQVNVHSQLRQVMNSKNKFSIRTDKIRMQRAVYYYKKPPMKSLILRE